MGAATARRFATLPEVLLRKTRVLPWDGDVLVRLGDPVRPTDVVARARRPLKPVVVMVGDQLGVRSRDLSRLLRRWAGEAVQRDEVLAEKRGFFGLGKRVCRSPIEGTVVSGPHSAGDVVLSVPDEEIKLLAGLPGRIATIMPHRGVVIETLASYLQGVGGYGDEVFGKLLIGSGIPGGEIGPDRIDEECQGAVLVGGRIGREALARVVSAGAAGVVVGSISSAAFQWLLADRPPVTVVVTEGNGARAMMPATFNLLQSRRGMLALINGRPQANAGPEVVVPLPGSLKAAGLSQVELSAGALARVGAGAWAGRSGRIVDLPLIPCRMPSGVVAQVVKVELEGGETVLVARDNVMLLA